MTSEPFAAQEQRKAWSQDAVNREFLAAEQRKAEHAVWAAVFSPGSDAPDDSAEVKTTRVGVKGSTNGRRDTARGIYEADRMGRSFFGL